MSESITVQMLLDVKLEIEPACKVAFNEHGECFIVHTDDETGDVTAQNVEYVLPVKVEVTTEAAEDDPADGEPDPLF